MWDDAGMWLTDSRSRSGSNFWIGVILIAIGALTFGGSVPIVGAAFTVAGVGVLVRAIAVRGLEASRS